MTTLSTAPQIEDLDLVTIETACEIIGGKERPIDQMTYYRGVKAGRYPPPIKVAPNIARVPRRKLISLLKNLIGKEDSHE